ncbi:hypothetical protein PHBOTO_003893 [Pseudozyma hubeiensis]|nr:hypothetical protein PHBOTO_003893 [Pseudozyma hubeiensis]
MSTVTPGKSYLSSGPLSTALPRVSPSPSIPTGEALSFQSPSPTITMSLEGPTTALPMAAQTEKGTNHAESKAARDKIDGDGSTDSGSLTQRAAMIRDELLGHDPLEHKSTHESIPSSGTTDVTNDDTSRKDDAQAELDHDVEERLAHSAISHSLRHIALAFDEKIQETHEDEVANLRAQVQKSKDENEVLAAELEELTVSRDTVKIHGIKAQAEAAESLSPAIRSADSTSQFSSSLSSIELESDHVSVADSSQAGATNVLGVTNTPIQTLLKEIEAKYST